MNHPTNNMKIANNIVAFNPKISAGIMIDIRITTTTRIFSAINYVLDFFDNLRILSFFQRPVRRNPHAIKSKASPITVSFPIALPKIKRSEEISQKYLMSI